MSFTYNSKLSETLQYNMPLLNENCNNVFTFFLTFLKSVTGLTAAAEG